MDRSRDRRANAMNRLNRLVCVVFVVALMPTGLRPADAADDDSPAVLLERLRAKDKGFDNAILRYTTSGEEVVDFPWWKFPPRNADEQESMKRGPACCVQFRFHEQMVVRGPDTTFTREADPDLKHEKGTWSVTPYQKWGQIGGVVREIIDRTGSGPGDRTFEIRKNDDDSVSMVSGQRMRIEFVHGFGFGKRIKTISSVIRAGNRRVIQGTIQLWSEDVSTFRIELGDDLLVKKATIDVDANANLTRYEVSTEGAVDRWGFLFAATGHFQRLALGLKNAQEKFVGPHVTDEFSTLFDDARFHLRDEEYKRRIMIEITPGTQVLDYVRNQVYRVEKDITITNIGPAVPK